MHSFKVFFYKFSRLHKFLHKKFYLAGAFFLLLGIFEIVNHNELSLLLYAVPIFLGGIFFSKLLCLRHNHLKLTNKFLLLFIVVSHVVHSFVDGFIFHNSIVSIIQGSYISLTSPLLIMLHEIFRQTALFAIVKSITESKYIPYVIIPGLFFLVVAVSSLGIILLPSWSGDIAILSYFFLAGEIMFHR